MLKIVVAPSRNVFDEVICIISFVFTFEPSGVQALKNPNPLKDVEGLAVLAVAELF